MVWGPEQQAAFERQGFVRLQGVFSREEAAAMEALLWQGLEQRHDVRRDDPATWDVPLATGLQPLRTHAVFAPNGGPLLLAALDGLIGKGAWQQPKHWGQLLVSFPVRPGAAPARAGWHTDFPYSMPSDRVAGALVMSFVGEVPPASGGTLVLAGSPALVARLLDERPELRRARMKVTRQALLQSDPWLAELTQATDAGDWPTQLLGRESEIGGTRLRVEELVGAPGDVVVGHPWLLHTAWPNHGTRPRLMRVQRIAPRAGRRRRRR